LPTDIVTERCGFLDALALDRVVVRGRRGTGGGVINPAADKTWYLATSVLGTIRDQRDCDAHLDYFDHREEIDRSLEESEAVVAELRQRSPSQRRISVMGQ